MAKDPSLEELRQILDPNKVFLSLALIKKLELAQDNSTWRAELEVLPDQEEVIARMTWDQVGPKTGIFWSCKRWRFGFGGLRRCRRGASLCD
jgi:hypothetical protein